MQVSRLVSQTPHCRLVALALWSLRYMFILIASLLSSPAWAEEADIVSSDVEVIDGDSIVIDNRQLDLLGIDAPELTQLCYSAAAPWPCGEAASALLAQFLVGKQIHCREVIINAQGQLLGRCGRLGLDAGAELVTRGLAVLDPAYRGYYLRNFREARYNSAGMVGGRFVVPWEWRDGKRLDPEQLKRDLEMPLPFGNSPPAEGAAPDALPDASE